MRILFVDDMPERYKAFAPRAIGHEVDWAKDEAEAMDRLKSSTYDVAFLDHDLCDDDYSKFGIGSGCRIADYIATNADRFRAVKFFVHSLNPVGAARMVETLQGAGLDCERRPWAWQSVSFNEPE